MPRRFICVFCTHSEAAVKRTLIQPQRRTAAQLRSLHSTGKVARPPNTAAAVLDDDTGIRPSFHNDQVARSLGGGLGPGASSPTSLTADQARQRQAFQGRIQSPQGSMQPLPQRTSGPPLSSSPTRRRPMYASGFGASANDTLLTEEEERQRRALTQRSEAFNRLRQTQRDQLRESERSIRKQLLNRPVDAPTFGEDSHAQAATDDKYEQTPEQRDTPGRFGPYVDWDPFQYTRRPRETSSPPRPSPEPDPDAFRSRTDRAGSRNSERDRRPAKPIKRRQADELEDDFDEDVPGGRMLLAERRRKRKEEAALRKRAAAPPPIPIPDFISVANLASLLKVKLNDFTKKLQQLGFQNQNHDYIFSAETAGLIAAEYRYEPVLAKSAAKDIEAVPEPEDKSSLPFRPPVVTIMGHVDHGKTTLLDYLRKSSIAASEHGGITQHIGAFSVRMSSGKPITFLDTPGHEAFLSMRQRGAQVTDVVILVVAADDSVKPQTIEAIKHAKSAAVPMVVAINKVDKPEANVQRVKQDLARNGVELEDVGGDTQAVCVSGKTGQGMSELEDAIITLSEILDVRADPEGQCEGWVLEAATKKAGRVASILVRRGTLRPGQVLVAGSTWTRTRTLRNEAGVEVDSVGPGTAVEVDGWKEVPPAGAEVLQCQDEGQAKSIVEFRAHRAQMTKMASDVEVVNELRRKQSEKHEDVRQARLERARLKRMLFKRNQQAVRGRLPWEVLAPIPDAASYSADPQSDKGPTQVPIVIKGDVGGSVEAVIDSVSALGNDQVRPTILRTGVGAVTESDVEMAFAAKGCIVAFNTPKVDPSVVRLAESMGVQILEHNIIYHLTDAVKARLSEELPDLVTHRVTGEAEVGEVFQIKLKGKVTKPVAGCKVRNGIIDRNSKVRVLRDREVIYDGTIDTLKNVKKDVTEMRKGTECGMSFGNDWGDFAVGDQVQCYEEIFEKRTL